MIPATPWVLGQGYEQTDPGCYISDARGLIVIGDVEGSLDLETADMIVRVVNAASAWAEVWGPT